MKRTLVAWFILMTLSLGWPLAAGASGPVPRTIQGCVIDGTLYSIRKDLVSERTGKRRIIAYPLKVANFDLTPYEGRKIRLQGNLLPGDRFTPDPDSLRILGPCDRQAKEAISQQRR